MIWPVVVNVSWKSSGQTLSRGVVPMASRNLVFPLQFVKSVLSSTKVEIVQEALRGPDKKQRGLIASQRCSVVGK